MGSYACCPVISFATNIWFWSFMLAIKKLGQYLPWGAMLIFRVADTPLHFLWRVDKPEKGGWCRNAGGEGCHFFITLQLNYIYSVSKSFLVYFKILIQVFIVLNIISFVHFWSILEVCRKCWLLYVKLVSAIFYYF